MVKLDRSPEVKTFVLFLSDIEVRKFGEQSGLDILVVLTVNAEYYGFGSRRFSSLVYALNTLPGACLL